MPKITDDQLDDIATAAIPLLNHYADLALGPPPARCSDHKCRQPATHTGRFRYFADPTDTELTEAVHELCAHHARWHEAAQQRRALVYVGRPVVAFTTHPGTLDA